MFKCEEQCKRNALSSQPMRCGRAPGPARPKLAEKPWEVPALVEIPENETNLITNPKSHPHFRNLVQCLYNSKVTQNFL